METEIYRFNGDKQISKDILEGLRNRELDIKFSYLGNGVKKYYDYDNDFIGEISDWIKLFKDFNYLKGDKKKVIISFGCGSSVKEIEIIKNMKNNEIFYIGVDFSEEMLELSKKNLENTNIKSYLIRSDISDIDLKEHIDYITNDFSERYFSFLGGTFSNIKTTNITDLLSYYMNKGDKLFFDLNLKDESFKSGLEIFRHYKEKTDSNKLWQDTMLSAFSHIGFPIEKGKILIRTEENNKVGIYKIIFYFKLLEDIIYKGKQDITILKGETIDFSDIYFYNVDKIKDYIKKHSFKFLNFNDKKIWGQFIFEKE